MNLSKREQILFNKFKAHGIVPLDNIIGRNKDRRSTIMRIKYLSAKVAPFGWIITKETGIGRGVKAIYKMEKKF